MFTFSCSSCRLNSRHNKRSHKGGSVLFESVEKVPGVSRSKVLHFESDRVAARQLLAQSPEITAITCYNDLASIGALQACAKVGRRVPYDVAVVGFDDIPLASLVTPALTTMRVQRHQLGEMVMELLRIIAAKGIHEEHLYIQPELDRARVMWRKEGARLLR